MQKSLAVCKAGEHDDSAAVMRCAVMHAICASRGGADPLIDYVV